LARALQTAGPGQEQHQIVLFTQVGYFNTALVPLQLMRHRLEQPQEHTSILPSISTKQARN
jgi:hypothetical protein